MKTDEVRLSFSCGEDWDAMTPCDTLGVVRHCTKCDRDVTDLSAMSEDDARACLAKVDAEGRRPCVRYAATEGQVLFGIREPAARRRLLAAAAALTLAVPAAAAVVDRATRVEAEPVRPVEVARGLFATPAVAGTEAPPPPKVHVRMGTWSPDPPVASPSAAPPAARPR
jgi:hypothetical protein